MTRIVLGITVAGLAAIIGYCLMAVVTDDVAWALIAAVVATVPGYWLGSFAAGGPEGHKGTHSPT